MPGAGEGRGRERGDAVSADFVDGHPAFVVHDEDGTVRVLDAVSPHAPEGLTKVLAWCGTSSRFEDLWHASGFYRHGQYLGGPAPTGMAAYEVTGVDRRRVTVGERQEAPARGGTRPDPSHVPGPWCGSRIAVYGPEGVVDATVLDHLVVHTIEEVADESSPTCPHRRGEVLDTNTCSITFAVVVETRQPMGLDRSGGRDVVLAVPAVRRVAGASYVTRRRGGHEVARERAGEWTSGGSGSSVAGRVAALRAAVEQIAAIDRQTLSDAELEGLLTDLKRPKNQLAAAWTQIAGELQTRAVRAAGPGREQRAKQAVRDRLRDQHQLSPSEAKKATETGAALRNARHAQDAFDAGDLSPEHAQVITNHLHGLAPEVGDRLERELTDLAGRLDPVALGREARRLRGRADRDAARRDDDRRYQRRAARFTRTAEGFLVFNGQLTGRAAEALETAILAFRTADTPGEARTPDQRTADAFEALAEAALQTGAAPTQHGVRPHVMVVVRSDHHTPERAEATFGGSGERVPDADLPGLLADSVISRIVTDARATPIEVSVKVRTVPAGLWTALLVRDRGCTWHGCSAPASWCDVAHGNRPYRNDGRLHLDDCALLCRRHHRLFDRGDWTLTVDGPNVTYQRPSADTAGRAPP